MIACVILNYNDSDTTSQLIDIIKDYKIIDKLIIVDNDSTDNSYEKLLHYKSKNVDVIKTEINKGYASGNNYAIKYALDKYKPDFFLIANPDVVFKEKTIERLLKCFKESNKAGVVSCRMKIMSDINLPLAWKLPSYKDCLLENMLVLRRLVGDRTKYKKDYYIDNTTKEVEVLPGSFFMISSNALIEAGFFDEGTFLYYEENILALKMKRLNYKYYLILDDEYVHYHSVSINKEYDSPRKRLSIEAKSRLYYCETYLDINRIQKLLFLITQWIGLNDYVICKLIQTRIRAIVRRRNCENKCQMD